MRVGYHYTTLKNWEKIEKEGLIPYLPEEHDNLYIRTDHWSLRIHFGENGELPKMIWIWEKKQSSLSHLGNILFQAASKNETKIVLLEVQFKKSDIMISKFKHKKGAQNIYHDGQIGNFIYHEQEEALLLKNVIPPERVILLKYYDLEELLS